MHGGASPVAVSSSAAPRQLLPLVFQAEMTTTMSDRDRGERDEHDVRLDPPVPRCGRAAERRARGSWSSPAADEARVVLVDVELAVEAEILGVGAQEALDVGLRGQHVELLLLERAQVLPADLGRKLGLREVEARCACALHEGCCQSRTRPPKRSRDRAPCRLLRPAQGAVHGERERSREPDVEAGPGERTASKRPGPVASGRTLRAAANRERRVEQPRPAGRADSDAGHGDVERMQERHPVEPRARRRRPRGPRAPPARRAARPRGRSAYCLAYGRPAAAGPIERPTTPPTAISVSRYGSAWNSVPHWLP